MVPVTDLDGNFSLSVPPDATLIVSFIGYTSIEVTVGGKTELGNITLVSDIKELDQVVVIGYGTQRKVDLTGSVAIVNTEEMKKVSHSNISTMLEGKVAGVQITSDGQPGADPISTYSWYRFVRQHRTSLCYRWSTNGNNNTRLLAKRYRNPSGT